jgi:hypothetical protein
MLSHIWCVTVDGVWIGYWIWCPRIHTTRNYKQLQRIANLHNSQITTALTKSFPSCCVFTSRSLATAHNSRDSSASCARVLPSPTLVQNCLPTIPSTEFDRHLLSASLTELNCTQHSPNSVSYLLSWPVLLVIKHRERPTENTISKNSSIVACVFVATGTCLTSCCLAMDVSSDSTIPAFRRHVTIY